MKMISVKRVFVRSDPSKVTIGEAKESSSICDQNAVPFVCGIVTLSACLYEERWRLRQRFDVILAFLMNACNYMQYFMAKLLCELTKQRLDGFCTYLFERSFDSNASKLQDYQ